MSIIAVLQCLDSVPDIINATQTSSTGDTYGNVTNYACNTGHQFPDDTTSLSVTCGDNQGVGQWSVPVYTACGGKYMIQFCLFNPPSAKTFN